MDRPVEERKPGREGGRHDRVVKGRQNRLARTSALEEEDDLALREEDHPAVDGARDDRLATVGEKLLCVFALSGLQASYENDPIDRAHVVQSRRMNSRRRKAACRTCELDRATDAYRKWTNSFS